MIYSTGEVIKLFETYKELIFVAFSGIFEGQTIKYNPNFRIIVWHKNDMDEAIELSKDFLDTKWKLISTSTAKLVKYPFTKIFKECLSFIN
jgi:hypothetical protein